MVFLISKWSFYDQDCIKRIVFITEEGYGLGVISKEIAFTYALSKDAL